MQLHRSHQWILLADRSCWKVMPD
uniref:Uncharacterized protein n=1 Tax=Arundo donax TaxID=35708 RepID=A0A0A9HCF8_ARUDO